MNTKQTQVMINKHTVGNDFRYSNYLTVADFRHCETVSVEAYLAKVSEYTIPYYQDLGWENIKIEATGEKYLRAYKVTGTIQKHKTYQVANMQEARQLQKRLLATA